MTAKRDKFVSIAEKRVARAMASIRVIGNLANKSNYEYSEQDVRKIIAALQEEIADLRQRFKNQGSRSQPTFKL